MCRNLLSSQGGDRPIAPTGERGGIGMGQDVESSGRLGEEMASPTSRGHASRAPGWFPWVFGFLLRLVLSPDLELI